MRFLSSLMRPKPRERKKPTERDWAIWQRINEDLIDWLYQGVTGRFQIAGHRQVDRWAAPHAEKTVLEVGCGHGHHLSFARHAYRLYIGLDIESKFLKTFQSRFAGRLLVQGDAYALPFASRSIDCVLSVYHFEHVRRLSDSLQEIHRVLKPEGELLVGIPLEGGWLYRFGRRLTSQRYMEKKYGIDYHAVVLWEHWNDFAEIEKRLEEKFQIWERRYLPFHFFPFPHGNVIQCLRLRPKPGSPSPRRIG